MHRLLAAEEHKSFRGRVWDHYSTVVGGGAGLDILNHPSYDPPCPSHCSWMPHIPDVGTYAYSKGFEHLLAIGDQQTFSRAIFSKRRNPLWGQMYTVLPGEWHFAVHALMAVHSLFWCPLLCWFAEEGHGDFCVKTVIGKWDSVVRFDDYRFFHETLIVAMLVFLNELVPDAVLADPDGLREALKNNSGQLSMSTYGHLGLAM